MSPDPTRFVFGGVAFDVHPAPGLMWELGPDHRTFKTSYESGPVAARVNCAVSAAPELGNDRRREISWTWATDGAELACGGVRARVRQIGDDRYAATAFVSPDISGCSSLCTAVVGALAAKRGGLVLHASGIEVDGGVVLFVGPSGAGKTTTANLCDGASWFARDRAVVFPTARGWHAAPMSGGDPIDLPATTQRILPLRGILRARRGADRPGITTCATHSALCVLRESLQTSNRTPEDEQSAIDAILSLCADVLVGEIHTVLHTPVLPTIRAWMAG